MEKKGWKRKWFVFWGLVTILLPFVQSFANGYTAIALTTNDDKTEQQLFDNEYGKAAVYYQTQEDHIDWQINIHKNDNKGPTRLVYSMTDVAKKTTIVPILAKEEQSTNLFEVKTNQNAADYGHVVEKEASTTIKNDLIKFTTPVVEGVNLKIMFTDNTVENKEETVFSKEYPIIVAKENETESTTAQTTSSSTTSNSTVSSSETAEETSEDVTNLGDVDEETFNSAKKEAEKKYVETGTPQTITRSAAMASDTATGSLVISDKVFNDPDVMKKTVSVTGIQPLEVVSVPVKYDKNGKATNIQNYNNYDDNKKKVSSFYLIPELNADGTRAVSGKVNIKFPNTTSEDALANTTVNVTYPKVGYINDQEGNLKEIGAKLRITNIKRSPSPKNWTGYPFDYPSIDLSSNLFSGTVTTGISSADWSFTFFYTDKNQNIDFSSVANGFMSFNSLNGYGKNGENGEFVKASDGRDGSVVDGSIIRQGTVSTPTGQNFRYQFDNVYYGSSNDFSDVLGGDTFNKASVKFDLTHTENTFQLGTGGGAGHRAWFTFASSAIVPVKQKAPLKTVQPIKQYKKGDTWDNPTGEESGWNQRFWNDLDRSDDGDGQWSLLPQYRVSGHDADTDNLAPGIPRKADRFVKTGQKYYYYINQPTINLASQGLVLPNGYKINDELPKGIVIDTSDNKPLTLFDLNGNDITGTGKQNIPDASKVEFELSPNQVGIINTQSKASATYGADFSLRVRVVVTNTTTDLIKDLMTNSAESTFSYSSGKTFTAKSNSVQTKVKSPIMPFDLSLKKIDSNGSPLSGAKFKLSEGNLGDAIEATSDSAGRINFNTRQLIAGQKYKLQEIDPPFGYTVSSNSPWQFEIREDGNSATLTNAKNEQTDLLITKMEDYNLISFKDDNSGIINNKEPLTIQLVKKDIADSSKIFTNEELSTAEFVIRENVEGGSEKEAVILKNGIISFSDLDWTKSYVIEEKKAPEGYIKLNQPIEISFTVEQGKLVATIVGLDNIKNPVEVSEKDAVFNLSFDVPNKPKVPLPATGGKGVWLIYGAGALALIVAGGYYFLRNKSKGEA